MMKTDRIAAIDLGSNSFRLVIATAQGTHFNILLGARERVQLARGLDDKNNISHIYWQRGLAAIQVFRTLLTSYGVGRVQVVATNVFRVANNAREWIEAAEQILRHPIEIITGKREAELIYYGAATQNPHPEKKTLIVDIGGGSTEFAVGTGFAISDMMSCSVGCISYQNRYFVGETITLAQFEAAADGAKTAMSRLGLEKLDWEYCLGCSGTAGACYFLLKNFGWIKEKITLKRLRQLREKLIKLELYDKLPSTGLSVDRKEIFPSGLAILIAVFEYLNIDGMYFSKSTIREGVLWTMQHNTPQGRVVTSRIKS